MTAVDLLNRVKIKAMLISDRRVGDLDIDVEVHGGTVTLRGMVESEEQKSIAEQLAREIQAIREVDNEIRIDPEGAWSVVDETTPPAAAVIPGPATTGPAVGAPFAMSTYAGGAVPPPGIVTPAEEVRSQDGVMADAVEKRIAEDGRITSKNINVTVDSGTARLSGIVDSVEEYYLVQEAAESVSGISRVQNDLQIEEGHKGHKCNCGRM